MTVTDNGKVIANYPFSGGRTTDPTMNGTHIVLDRESVVRMISSSNGIPVDSPDGYDELVYSDVHITDSGEYVHAAPWSVTSQGHANVSHGCINLSPADALTFFGLSRVGDIVMVTGGPRPRRSATTASWTGTRPGTSGPRRMYTRWRRTTAPRSPLGQGLLNEASDAQPRSDAFGGDFDRASPCSSCGSGTTPSTRGRSARSARWVAPESPRTR